MSDPKLALMAHLMRRAGFGATRGELEGYMAKGHEAVVEELLHPADPQNMPDDIIRRYHVDLSELRHLSQGVAYWLYRMITTKCPLEEKIALFWHSLFATSFKKLNHPRAMLNQIDMFRRQGLGSFPTLLVELSKDPAMTIWLDNQDNHKGAINENYGRELMELFSMGIGNYTEQDIKECARAFTGWTLENAEWMAFCSRQDSVWPYGRIDWHFEYRDYDHDEGEKTFLGETGRFNGEDVIDIIVRQEITARFICGRLFQYFAADEVTEEGEQLIQTMMGVYFESGYEIRSVLRTLFNSDYFKSEQVRFARMKGPAELLVSAVRLAGSYRTPNLAISQLASQVSYMGQGLLDPPSVEGWHEGQEWIDSGSLVERVNFAAKELGDVLNPGVRAIIERLAAENGGVLSPERLVERCLDVLGPITVSDHTLASLVRFAAKEGDVHLAGRQPGDTAEQQIGHVLRLIASTKEFQLA